MKKVFLVYRDSSCNDNEGGFNFYPQRIFTQKEAAVMFCNGKKMFQEKDDYSSYQVMEMELEEGDFNDVLAKAGLGPKAQKRA